LLSPGFSLVRHFCAFGAITSTTIVMGVWLARRVRVVDLWIVPAYLLVSSVTEYLVHRLLMHRPLWPRRLYRAHTLGHHRAFHHDSMEVDGWRELDLVMMPWFTVGIFFAGIAPVAALVGWTLGRGASGLFLLTAVVSFTTYEGMHALYHFPLRLLGRAGLLDNRLFRSLYRHHLHHHRLARMRWVNFNISMPFADRLFGTLETEATWRADRARREHDTDAADPEAA
jgi:hypothetical protein